MFGVDLRDYWRSDLTARRLWVLIEHKVLIAGTATAVALHGAAGRWTHTDQILAAIADPHYKNGYPRPEDKVRTAQLRDRVQAWRQRHRAQSSPAER